MTGQSSALYFALTDMWTLEAVIFQKGFWYANMHKTVRRP